jgi:hypothetical protein
MSANNISYNEGCRLTYVRHKQYEEIYNKLAPGHNEGIMLYDNIEQTAGQVARKWVHGAWSPGNSGDRNDYYFDSRGGFAVVGRKRNGEEMPVSHICFVNLILSDLENTARYFSLPFDAKNVQCNREH